MDNAQRIVLRHANQVQYVEPQEDHTFLVPLYLLRFNFGNRCFGLYRYNLTYGKPSRSLAHSFWDTLCIYIYI